MLRLIAKMFAVVVACSASVLTVLVAVANRKKKITVELS